MAAAFGKHGGPKQSSDAFEGALISLETATEKAQGGAHSSDTPNKKKPIARRVAVLCVIGLIPVIVAALFLLTSFDPYGNTKHVPAVIVNNDRGAEIDGTERNIGLELIDSLIEDNSLSVDGEVSGFDWTFVQSETSAAQGLRDGAYYVEVVIPENFSEAIASASTSEAVQAELKVYYNPAVSYGAQTIGEGFINKVIANLNKDIQGEYFDNLFVTLKESGSDILTVANAGLDVTDGLVTAQSGSDTIADGLDQLADGSAELTSGLYTAGDGANQLASGADQLASGVTKLGGALGQLKTALETSSSTPEVRALTEAMSEVGSYLQAYGEEASKPEPDPDLEQQYLDGAAQAAKKAAAANATIGNPLVAYISGGTFSYTSGTTTVSGTETGLIPALDAYVKASNELEAFERDELQPLLETLQELRAEIDDLEDVGEQVSDDIDAYMDAVNALQAALEAYKDANLAYLEALEEYARGEITAEELKAYRQAISDCETDVTNARADLTAARKAVSYDFYHTDESGNPAGLLVDLGKMGETAVKLWGQIGSIDHVEELVTKLVELITAQATAGAAAQGAAGKCEGYLVGVAVASSYANSSIAQMSSAVSQIYSAVVIGSGDSTSLVSGTAQLASGATSLAAGITTAADGSSQITVNLGTVASGEKELSSGLGTAASTSSELFNGLLTGKQTLDEQTENSEQRSSVLSSPVSNNSEELSTVANYGTSVAPYYFGVGLWAACLLASLVLCPISRTRFTKRDLTLGIALKGFWPLAALTAGGAVIALAVIQFVFAMNVNYPIAYYLLAILAALAFTSINQFLVGHFGIGGAIASVILLVAQLAFAAATFPLESAMISMLAIAGKLLPMAYLVSGLRIAMCGMDALGATISILVLLGVFVLFFVLTLALIAIKRRSAIRKAYADMDNGGSEETGNSNGADNRKTMDLGDDVKSGVVDDRKTLNLGAEVWDDVADDGATRNLEGMADAIQ